MCVEVWLERDGMRWQVEFANVRSLQRIFRVLVPSRTDGLYSCNAQSRFATHCLCPVDVPASAAASGYDCVWDPWGYRVKRAGVGRAIKRHTDERKYAPWIKK